MICLDIGCGSKKREGHIGLDQFPMEGVDHVVKLGEKGTWNGEDGKPLFEDNSVDSAVCSHFLEHLSGQQRVYFMNELYRILKPGAKVEIITPHWNSTRAYGDFTHAWPPVCEMYYYYLSQEWRDTQAPHTDAKWNPEGYNCNFGATWGYSFSPELSTKNQEYINFALQNFKESAQDLIATLTKA